MAMVGVVLSFAGLFADMGLNAAFMQRQKVTDAERSSLFWFNVSVCVAITALAMLTSPVVAWVYRDDRLMPLMLLSSTSIVLGALGSQVGMAAAKALNFRPIVILELVGAIVSFSATLLAALAGWGVYALVAGGIVGSVFGTAMAWVFLANGWRPQLRLRMADLRPFMHFGLATVGNNLVNQINMTVDMFLGGRLLGAAQLGLYSVPRNVILEIQFMVNPIITRVGFPLIAQVQDDVARVRSIYLKTMNMTASTNGPIYLSIAFFVPDIVAVLLGDRWRSIVPLFRLLAVWGLFRSLGNPVGSLLMGMGRAGLSLKWNLGMLLIMPPAIWAGSQFGAMGMAWTMMGMAIAVFVPAWYVLVRPLCGASLMQYATAALWPFVLALACIAPAFWAADQFAGPVLRLAVGAMLAVPLYIALSIKLNTEWFAAVRGLLGLSTPS